MYNPIIRSLTKLLSDRKARGQGRATWLAEGLARLGPVESACILLRERDGLPVAEITRVTGLDSDRVRLALFAAREELRGLLRSEAERSVSVG